MPKKKNADLRKTNGRNVDAETRQAERDIRSERVYRAAKKGK